VYRRIELKPDPSVIRTAKLIKKTAPSVAQALIQLREYSDGFQYHDKLVGTIKCEGCIGAECKHCAGRGEFKQYEKVTVECETPKVEALKDILDLKEDDGRLIIYAGFTGSIDRVCATVKGMAKKWNYIRVDGRGWSSDLGTNDPQKLLDIFQNKQSEYPNVAFVGHPQSCGMGLTLTASDTIVYYSNDFNAESRLQSESRIHRIGSRGCNIIDLIHLPVDLLVLENLVRKQELMKITMGDLDACFGTD
jgi:SNF2 family DNA or RNA helicase